MLDCRDILDAVYFYVKDIYIARFYSSEVKSKTSSENHMTNESLKEKADVDVATTTNTNVKETNVDVSENVESKIERMSESDVRMTIRQNVQEKTCYALASVCSNLAKLDRMYRELKGYDAQPEFSEYFLDTVDEFPLSDRFVFPCVMFVSSMVLIDVDEAQSDKFYDKYACSVSQIASEIPMESESIAEKYPY